MAIRLRCFNCNLYYPIDYARCPNCGARPSWIPYANDGIEYNGATQHTGDAHAVIELSDMDEPKDTEQRHAEPKDTQRPGIAFLRLRPCPSCKVRCWLEYHSCAAEQASAQHSGGHHTSAASTTTSTSSARYNRDQRYNPYFRAHYRPLPPRLCCNQRRCHCDDE